LLGEFGLGLYMLRHVVGDLKVRISSRTFHKELLKGRVLLSFDSSPPSLSSDIFVSHILSHVCPYSFHCILSHKFNNPSSEEETWFDHIPLASAL
jgi:hypothetical protein